MEQILKIKKHFYLALEIFGTSVNKMLTIFSTLNVRNVY